MKSLRAYELLGRARRAITLNRPLEAIWAIDLVRNDLVTMMQPGVDLSVIYSLSTNEAETNEEQTNGNEEERPF